MRHLLSIVLSLVLAPLVYAGAGYAAVKFAAADPTTSQVLLGLSGVVIAGALYAPLVMARISPVGPLLAGLAFLGVTLWALVDRDGFLDLMPSSVLGAPGALALPAGATAGVLALPLLLTVASPRRWRQTEIPGPTGYAAYTPPIYTPPEYGSAGSAAPTYPTSDPVITTWSAPSGTSTFSLPTQRAERMGDDLDAG
jgi:hypothetical protein